MRHYRDTLWKRGLGVLYRQLDDPDNSGSLGAERKAALGSGGPERIVLCEPGEWRVEQAIRKTAGKMNVPLEIRPDLHFLCSGDEFAEHATGRKPLRIECFYRQMRRKAGVLMDASQPASGKWN